MKVAPVIELTEQERDELEKWSRGGKSPARARERSRIVLLAAEGLQNQEIARRTGMDRRKAGRWRQRYTTQRLAGILKDKTRPPGKPAVSQTLTKRILRLTLHGKPDGATHWSRETMAREAGVSPSSVGRIWAAPGLQPHRVKSFKLSNDKHFAEKREDIVGLYLSPPEHAVVLSCDEPERSGDSPPIFPPKQSGQKSQIQALDRTQPGLPLKKGRCQTMTDDYKRNGTTSLFAAMNAADGSVIGTCMNKHRHQEWLRFLNPVRRRTPRDKEIHLICDNYATPKHEKGKAWQKRNPRFHFHFTPTSASWLNMVERFFRDLTERSLRRGVFHSLPELIAAIERPIATHNASPKPFVWTATASDILEKVKRGRRTLHKTHSV